MPIGCLKPARASNVGAKSIALPCTAVARDKLRWICPDHWHDQPGVDALLQHGPMVAHVIAMVRQTDYGVTTGGRLSAPRMRPAQSSIIVMA